jgi:uncharacterized protein
MSAKPFDSSRLDVAALAAEKGEQWGQWPLVQLVRLAESVLPEETPDAQVHWQIEGELRPVTGASPEIWLHLTAQAAVAMRCQRCLGAVGEPLDLDRWIRFVADGSQVEALDAELEDDVLVLERWMNLRDLVEDELLLALPIVPRHEVCPVPLPRPADDDVAGHPPPPAHPFAVLAKLRKKPDA